MNILHINTTSHSGGAAKAMQRLHDELLAQKHQSEIIAGRNNLPGEPHIHLMSDVISPYQTNLGVIQSRLGSCIEDFLGLHPWTNRPTLNLPKTKLYEWADIIDLRNLHGGYINLWVLPGLSLGKPVVWRLPDLWALTGYCAYPYDCKKWKDGCHDCPLLKGEGRLLVEPKPPPRWDGTRRVWLAKQKTYLESKLHIVVNSEWMRKKVNQGILKDSLSVNVISNGVDLDIYKPIDKQMAREKLGLPPNEIILLWGAASLGNLRKGYSYTARAMELIQNKGEIEPLLITMGNEKRMDEKYPLGKVKHFGFVKDPASQVLMYNAADLFLCSTLADAQPQTAVEALACGTPVIAYDIGPMPELIQEGKTGFIAPDVSVESLAATLEEVLDNPEQLVEMGQYCREEAEQKYDLSKQTKMYIDLYENILTGKTEKKI
ncbi:MAG: glycosyltransferase [Anaerolineales bacterium]|nr:glycosyltransferase [Anaerolineales bacterium]